MKYNKKNFEYKKEKLKRVLKEYYKEKIIL
jgi:hypothetical protein